MMMGLGVTSVAATPSADFLSNRSLPIRKSLLLSFAMSTIGMKWLLLWSLLQVSDAGNRSGRLPSTLNGSKSVIWMKWRIWAERHSGSGGIIHFNCLPDIYFAWMVNIQARECIRTVIQGPLVAWAQVSINRFSTDVWTACWRGTTCFIRWGMLILNMTTGLKCSGRQSGIRRKWNWLFTISLICRKVNIKVREQDWVNNNDFERTKNQ